MLYLLAVSIIPLTFLENMMQYCSHTLLSKPHDLLPPFWSWNTLENIITSEKIYLHELLQYLIQKKSFQYQIFNPFEIKGTNMRTVYIKLVLNTNPRQLSIKHYLNIDKQFSQLSMRNSIFCHYRYRQVEVLHGLLRCFNWQPVEQVEAEFAREAQTLCHLSQHRFCHK